MIVVRQEKTSGVKNINKTLQSWDLKVEWESIKEKSVNQWKAEVDQAAEKIKIENLKAACHIKKRNNLSKNKD